MGEGPLSPQIRPGTAGPRDLPRRSERRWRRGRDRLDQRQALGQRRLLLVLGDRHRDPDAVYGDIGRGTDRADCMRKFKEAWARFADDDANLTMFLAEKRRARRDR